MTGPPAAIAAWSLAQKESASSRSGEKCSQKKVTQKTPCAPANARSRLSSSPTSAATTVDMVEPLSKRIADLGWHAQFNVDGAMILEMEALLNRLPSGIVFDHLAHPALPAGIEDESHKIVRRLIDKGKTWVKLSGAYSNTQAGPPYPDATKIAQEFVRAAPERRNAFWIAPACACVPHETG